ncbi:MAG: NAD(P)-dependent oxidoreductase [Actinobacteria bacterium]|nr:MAG: NAD(P)-dependent oxidoreductase [Actinomycetota bacterium]
MVVGVLHPGEMGAAIGAALRGCGHTVLWASSGRSPATADRARLAGLEDLRTAEGLARRSEVILSVCPPHAAAEVAKSTAEFNGIYVDANAIAPATSRSVGAEMARYVDGGIIGPPPHSAGTTRLYLSGTEARDVASLFAGTTVDARVLSVRIGDASALKMVYAAWTKGTAALLLAIGNVARATGVDDALQNEWALSLPGLPDAARRAASSASAKGWRWVGEMEEIASTFAAASQPAGFHSAAADVFRGT